MRNALIVVAALIVAALVAGLLVYAFLTPRPQPEISSRAAPVAAAVGPTPTIPRPQGKPLATTGFNGVFAGMLEGDNDSSAPGTLELAQNGKDVTGAFTIAPGLYIDGGRCGEAEVPPGTQSATGTIDPKDPNKMRAEVTVKQSGLTITITLDGALSKDGKTLTGTAKADLPFLCGRDPVIIGEFERQ